MTCPVTLFTGQWADLPLEEVAARAETWGFDGLELSCWLGHFDVDRALAESDYCAKTRSVLERHGLSCFALAEHLVSQAVCDRIDARHQAIVPPRIWGDGEDEGVRRRAAEHLKDVARAAAALGVDLVVGFTGSPIWSLLYAFPPVDFASIEYGYQEVAERFAPILDVFEAEGVRFCLHVHPVEIAYDFITTRMTLEALEHRPSFGLNVDPGQLAHQFLDSAAFVLEFGDRIYNVHITDSKKQLDGRRSVLGGHLGFGDPRRAWNFVAPGHGDVDFASFFRSLDQIGYTGALSIEYQDSTLDRDWVAQDAFALVRRMASEPSRGFDAPIQAPPRGAVTAPTKTEP